MALREPTPAVQTPPSERSAGEAPPQNATAQDLVRWAAERFGERVVMSSSFGAQSAVLLHLVTRVVPDMPVILADTGYLFPETYRFAEQLRERFGLNLKVTAPAMTTARLEALHGNLWTQGREGLARYHELMKVDPLRQSLDDLGAEAWIAGLRRSQGGSRSGLMPTETQDGRLKVHPLWNWSRADVGKYMVEHDLPYHPLVERGYASIGDVHSTRPVSEQEGERDGRFNGFAEECGLHVPRTLGENDSLESAGL
ncbi:MAG: phosphoadenylyl-sulfate reductase [Planctomycetota bacterium]